MHWYRPKDYANLNKKKWAENTWSIFGGKNYNCDFLVLKIISQQKVLVGALVKT